MSGTQMYSLSSYGEMIADRVRIEAFSQALRAAIRPGSVVVDIGTGPGSIAVLACRLGAGRVFAIEPDPVIQVAREVAACNGCADKIEFFEELSTEVELPVRADVIVSDMRGVLPLFTQHIPSIADARKRFLAPGGVLIARRDTIWAAVAEAPEAFGKVVDSWNHNVLGLDFSAARRRVVNEFRKTRLKPEQLLTPPQLWATLDYATVENPHARGTLHFAAERKGIGHGLLVWFDMELSEGISFSNGPASPEAIYGSAFFPWPEPVSLTAGQNVCIELEANLLGNDYFWRWTTRIESPERPGETLPRFEQSYLHGMVLSAAKLKKAASTYIPEFSEEGRMRFRALQLIGGKASLEQIARQLAGEFPERFPGWHQALAFAGALSQEYSR